MTWLLLLLACSPSKDRPHRTTGGGTPVGTPVGTPAGTPSTGTPGGTTSGTWATQFDCSSRPEAPFAQTAYNIRTEEDFSFDTFGRLVYQEGSAIVGISITGDLNVLTASAPGDPAGLDIVSETQLLIAGPDTGTLRLFDITAGTGVTLMSNLSQPNTVLGGNDGMYYVAELYAGRVRWYDPVSGGDGPVIGGLDQANGLALSLDEQTMYVGGTDTIWAVERDNNGTWDPDTAWPIFQDVGKQFYTIEVDFCGWIYVVGYSDGAVKRISPDGSAVEPVAQLSGWSWGGMNFGTDVGGWNRDWLYLTDRSQVVGIEVGIPGARGPNILPP